jgi:hypothetical protein
MSEIRHLLADAQRAETRGEHAEAIRLLRRAADWYQQRKLDGRARQMLRQASRLAGETVEVELIAVQDDGFGFGDELEEDLGPAAVYELPDEQVVARLLEEPVDSGPPPRPLVEQRGPALADPHLDAWCSFCCRPKTEVGPVIAGPAGAYICAECVGTSARLASLEVSVAAVTTTTRSAAVTLLPVQQRVIDRLRERRHGLALILGVEGTGKTTLLQHLRDDEVLIIDGHELPRLTPGRRAVIAMRAEAPTPSLVLPGPHGDEHIYDTSALAAVVPLPHEVLVRVDGVYVLSPPTPAELGQLARALLLDKGAVLNDVAIDALVALAVKSGRGVTELAALVSRVPAGRYA